MVQKIFRKKTFFLVLFLLIFNFPPAAAQKEIALSEAIEMALEKNKAVLVAKEGLSVARGLRTQARSAFLPKLEAEGAYIITEELPEMEIPKDSFVDGFPPEDTSASMDFTYDYSLNFNLTQPLFTGGKIWYANRQASLNYRVAEEKYRQSREAVILQVKTAFYGALLAQEFVNLTREALSLAKEHLRITKNRYRAGEIPEYEVLSAEVELANLKPNVIKAENGMKLALLGLKNILGLGLEEEISVKGGFEKTEFAMDLDECISKGIRERADLSQLNYQKEMGEHMVRLARAGYFPNLALVGSYQMFTNELAEAWGTSYSVLLGFSMPLFEGFLTRGKMHEAKGILRTASLGQEMLQEGIKLEIRQTYNGVEEARELIAASEEAVRMSKRGVQIAEVSYAQGVITSLEVMGARLALTQAKTSYIQALYDYIISIAKLENAMRGGRVELKGLGAGMEEELADKAKKAFEGTGSDAMGSGTLERGMR
ncbi:MAG: TolC family protein [Deltaproteobacteria bacterium]|nr:MAG: TolC family protein [Deltaproteobacteria bacterium]